MNQWMKQFNEASYQTKLFIFMAALYGISLIVTTVYSYARLDYVRSYKIESDQSNNKH